MTLFDILKDILTEKTGKFINNNEFDEIVQNTYILQRWLSMYNIKNAYLISETTNKLCKSLSEDKELCAKLFITLIDKQKSYKKITFLKREKRVKNEEKDELVKKMANKYERSTREILNNMKLIEDMEEKA
jgi:hypothetical protein